MILGLDTASAMSSVALVDAGMVVAAEEVEGARLHVEALAPMLARVLVGVQPESISAIACDVGPGPYSGLRVAIASAIACGLAWNAPVYGLCSLDAIAAAQISAAGSNDDFGVAVDARRKEVYWGWYAEGQRVAGPRVGRRDELPAEYRDGPWIDSALPHAIWVARTVERLLAEGVSVMAADLPLAAHGDDGKATADALVGHALLPARPLYLRRPDVTISPANAGARP